MPINLKWLKSGQNILQALKNFRRKNPLKGWLLRRGKDEPNPVHLANMAKITQEYMQGTIDNYVWRILNRLAVEPPTLENMLVLKGEAKALFLLIQGMDTSISQGEETAQ